MGVKAISVSNFTDQSQANMWFIRHLARPTSALNSIRFMSTHLPSSSIPLFNTVASYRLWRQEARSRGQSVGFVPTMGALHEGHLSLVKRSLAENDLTVVSVFVNPAQFAPHEDLATYPRTLPKDLEQLEALSFSLLDTSSGKSITRTPSAVFVPTVDQMYPSGITQTVSEQKGTFVEVKGYGHQMEGQSRPTFFRGVATVVTKLFNAVEPTNAYFGQKDIQQALLLRRLCRDLLLSHPDPEHLHIVPTARDPTTGLALSSRNVYLTDNGRKLAPTLYQALSAAAEAWSKGQPKKNCVHAAQEVVNAAILRNETEKLGLEIRLDYVELNDSDTFEVLSPETSQKETHVPVILSGALWVDKTRLIDNIILGDTSRILA